MAEKRVFDNEVALGSRYGVSGTANPEVRGMILHPENFYEPPTKAEWEQIETNRNKRDKIKTHFQQMIEDSIVSDALLLHEQNLELHKGQEFGIDAGQLAEIKQYILAVPEDMNEDELLAEAEIACEVPLGSLKQIIDTVESQNARLDQIKMSIDQRRAQFLEAAKKSVEQESKELIDPLTGGLSQTGLENYYYTEIADWSKEKKADECVLLVAFDLDSFKIVNDEKGHVAGDKVLQDVVAKLKQGTPELRGLRKSDGIGRRSGDEFILILQTKNDERSISELLQRIRDLIGSVDNPLGGKISASGGVLKMSFVEVQKLSYKQACERADSAGNWTKIHKPGSLQLHHEGMGEESAEILSPAELKEWIEQKVKRAKRRVFDKLHLALRKAEAEGNKSEVEKLEELIGMANTAVDREVDLQLEMLKHGVV